MLKNGLKTRNLLQFKQIAHTTTFGHLENPDILLIQLVPDIPRKYPQVFCDDVSVYHYELAHFFLGVIPNSNVHHLFLEKLEISNQELIDTIEGQKTVISRNL